MSKTHQLAKLNLDCEVVINYMRQYLLEQGVQTMRSFDLQSACASYPDLTCTHHENLACDCQLVILLAYGQCGAPASLVVHSHKGQTDIQLIKSPGNQPGKDLESIIRSVFEMRFESSLV